jgi:hypothetical protein
VLGSPFFSGFASAVPAVVRSVHPAWMPDPKRLLEPHESYVRDQYRLTLRTLVLQGLLALTAAWLWHFPCQEAGRSYHPPGQDARWQAQAPRVLWTSDVPAPGTPLGGGGPSR